MRPFWNGPCVAVLALGAVGINTIIYTWFIDLIHDARSSSTAGDIYGNGHIVVLPGALSSRNVSRPHELMAVPAEGLRYPTQAWQTLEEASDGVRIDDADAFERGNSRSSDMPHKIIHNIVVYLATTFAARTGAEGGASYICELILVDAFTTEFINMSFINPFLPSLPFAVILIMCGLSIFASPALLRYER
jgi:hypothetical protein